VVDLGRIVGLIAGSTGRVTAPPSEPVRRPVRSPPYRYCWSPGSVGRPYWTSTLLRAAVAVRGRVLMRTADHIGVLWRPTTAGKGASGRR
jgi:hypothetical protein